MRSALLWSLLAATALSGPALADETVSAWRLFIADHAEPVVRALDLESGEVLNSFPLASPAALYTTASGEAIFAVQGAGNQVSAISTGIAVHDHGDHGDIEISPPALIDAAVAGERPVHFVEHGGRIALFFDGTGTAALLGEHGWVDHAAVEAVEFDSGAPHHGVAVPWGDYTILSVPHPEDPSNLPIGVNVLDIDGNVVGDLHACADLHGEAASGNMQAIACAEGLLIVTGSGAPEITKLAYASLPEGKSTTLLGGVGLQYFLGNYGADKVVTIDPAADAPFQLIELPTRRVHFAVDPIRPRFAYVFTEDGKLHQLDIVAGAIAQSVQVTGPYSMDGAWDLPRPRIAVADDLVAVTDPDAGAVRLIDIASFSERERIVVDGTPFNLVAVGASGTRH